VRGHTERAGFSRALADGTHLAVLSAFGVTQPLLDILGRHPAFFAVRGSTGTEIVLLVAGLTLAPAVALLGVKLAAGLVAPTLARSVHLAAVAALVAIIALHVLASTADASGPAAVLAAGVTGTLAAVVYARVRAARAFLTLLAPAPLVFAAAFLFGSPVTRLVFADAPAVQAATVRARTPVVLVVLDELSTVALMDRRGRVDAIRYPAFGALARDATWYRSATTSAWQSEIAVPSVFTGREPNPDLLPVYADHPRNLFTLLGSRYRVRAVESLTRLCPPRLCAERRSTQASAAMPGSLLADVGVVYLNVLLPEPYVRRVPSVEDSWGGFGRTHGGDREREEGAGSTRPCGRNVCSFVDLLEPDRRPTLYVLHTVLPHMPYVYLPSGRRYAADAPVLRGLRDGRWVDRWGARLSYQRYLLQVGYADRALGLILERLRATGLYERALVVVTADHGVTFRVGAPRRKPVRETLDDIAFVPLFVKLPGQRRGRIDDRLARTVDVVPTIANALRVEIPWRVDGRSLLRPRPADGVVSVVAAGRSRVTARLRTLRAQRARTLRRQVAAFGTGSFEAVLRFGSAPALLGGRVSSLTVRGGTAEVELDRRSLLAAVDPTTGLVPTYLDAQVHGGTPGRQVALAVNGTIAAVTRTYRQRGTVRFAAFVPERALRSGANTVEVYYVAGREPVLEQLRARDRRYELASRNRRDVVVGPGGAEIPLVPGALRGRFRLTRRGGLVVFSGWASDRTRRHAVKRLVVFVDGRDVFNSAASVVRPHRILGESAPRRELGFRFDLPAALVPEAATVRVVAIRRRVATALERAG
jgi:hypothetical protein